MPTSLPFTAELDCSRYRIGAAAVLCKPGKENEHLVRFYFDLLFFFNLFFYFLFCSYVLLGSKGQFADMIS